MGVAVADMLVEAAVAVADLGLLLYQLYHLQITPLPLGLEEMVVRLILALLR